MKKIDICDIQENVESAFEMMLEDVEFYINESYEDMTSERQKEFVEKLKIVLNKLCDEELNRIKQDWTDDSSEVKHLKNRIKELESRVSSLSSSDWSEDMGK